MRKERVFQAAGLAFALIGVFMVVEGWGLGVEGMYGPGPGFFAFIVGVALTAISLIWLGQVTFRPAQAGLPDVEFEPRGLTRVLLVLLALVVFSILLAPLGFNLTMLALLLFLLIGYSRKHLLLKLALAVLFSFGTHYVFEQILRVPLPYASIETLRALGL